MCPTGPALNHPAAPVLLKYATDGCPVDCGADWSLEKLDEAVAYAAHPSAEAPEATKALHEEVMEKVTDGYVDLIPWDVLRKNPPKQLKISPIAAIPHKSRDFRMILDLSFVLKNRQHVEKSINDYTQLLSDHKSMVQLGQSLPRLIWHLAFAPEDQGPLFFTKLDLKDGYWRMIVQKGAEYNFAYVLPKLKPTDPTQIVIPRALQMGWTESPGYFCMASETARDIAKALSQQPFGTLPQHEHEAKMEPDVLPAPPKHQQPNFLAAMEVFIDDFIWLVQTSNRSHLQHYSRAALHAVHSVFPPPRVTGHHGPDSISLKKIATEGKWDTQKEILGWLFDGLHRELALPTDKVDKIIKMLNKTRRSSRMNTKELESLRGKLRHACIGLPAGKALMSPFDRLIQSNKQWTRLNRDLLQSVRDWKHLLRQTQKTKIKAKQLVIQDPHFLGAHDASGKGAGGVLFGGTDILHPTVWRVIWPQEIRDNLVSTTNPTGTITNSDLELAGALLQFLTLELITDVKHKCSFQGCDNTPTVSWIRKMGCTSSRVAAALLRILAIRLHKTQASPLSTMYLEGKQNSMADDASRLFKTNSTNTWTYNNDDMEFLTYFNSAFPLQTGSWRLFRFNPELVSRIISELLTPTSTMASWSKITKKGHAFGTIGSPTAKTVTYTPSSQTQALPNPSPPWKPSPQGSDAALIPTKILSASKQSKQLYAPSDRPSSWTSDDQIPAILRDPPNDITDDSTASSKVTAGTTHLHNQS